MKYADKIYGNVEIADDVIIEIISSQSFQRLKGIDQAGYFDVYCPDSKHSRFEHSVGCYILLKKFNASIEEQIAGLIHDISHSAFSHTADYIFETGRGADQNYQDDIFVDFIKQTDIPDILEKYSFDVDYILNEDHFPLQENDLPNLCADRIDYSLRGAFAYDGATVAQIDYFLLHLKIIDEKWVFDNYESAFQYAKLFKKINDTYYTAKEAAAMYLRTSQWIGHAVDNGYIKYKDLFTTDDFVIKKINKHLMQDEKLQKLWDEMNNPHVEICEGAGNGCEEVIVKSRIVDPLFLESNDIKKVSDINQVWTEIVRKNMQPKTYYLSVA